MMITLTSPSLKSVAHNKPEALRRHFNFYYEVKMILMRYYSLMVKFLVIKN